MSAFGPVARLHDLGKTRARLPLVADEESGKLRTAAPPSPTGQWRRDRAIVQQPRKVEREKIAALGRGERMQLIDDDRAEASRTGAPASRCDSMSAICSGVVSRMSGGSGAGAGGADGGVSPVRVSSVIGQAHLRHRLGQIAGDIDGKRLQRRDVEGVDAGLRLRCLAS